MSRARISFAPPLHSPLFGSVGRLAVDGTAAAGLQLAPGLGSGVAGLTAQHAFAVLGPLGVEFVSNAAPLTSE